MRKPKIVVVGGGTGLPVVLNSLRNQGAEITAVVTVADDGGSSGVIREELEIAPPGDIRNVLVSLSDMPQFYHDLFQYRFIGAEKSFSKHAIGNIIIAAVSEMYGSTFKAIQTLSKMMKVDGHVYPSSEEPLTLHAVFKDGMVVEGESKIANYKGTIDHVYVSNTYNDELPRAGRKVLKAIHDADMVVLGPGSLFTSILPNLVIKDIGEAIKETRAEVVYICNIMTQRGETEHFTDANHVRVLHEHLEDKFIDTVLVNNEPVPENYMNKDRYDEYLVQVVHDFDGLMKEEVRVISTDFLKLRDQGVFHDGDLVVEELFRIVFGRRI
ncbi:MAG: YvcK family protein [Streptococcaceae bacterium]|jgi:uncharacterized cofD-like protein|nr:YvcK family protein [Streptococcaceae bacterium]